MSEPTLLDLHDSNLQLWQGVKLLHQSPGYALLDGRQYQFGGQARGQARLRPREVNTRFWWQLSTETLRPALGPARHTGDLVHAHLLDIHQRGQQPGETVLTVSGSMGRDQLGLLLGIMQECPFDPVGLVNRSVALASLFARRDSLFHLEVQLHQALLTEIRRRDGQVSLTNTTPLPGCGLLALQERLVEVIAKAFINQTRFDPRKTARSEQELYDELPELLLQLRDSPEANMELGGYRARIGGQDLADAGRRLADALQQAGWSGNPAESAPQLLLDPLAGLLPGISNLLPGADLLARDALPRALRAHEVVQREAKLNFRTSLPFVGEDKAPASSNLPITEPAPTPASVTSLEPQAIPPTHLLMGHRAVALAGLPADADLPAGDFARLQQQQGHWVLTRSDGYPKLRSGPHQAGRILHSGDELLFSDGRGGTLIEVA